jgi:hypothetical protein
VRLQRELDQAQAGPSHIDVQQLDSDRLQRVYYTYDNSPQSDQAASSSYSPSSTNHSYSSGGRPGSARRTSKQQASGTGSFALGAGSIGVRPGSSAARRTKELLQLAGLSGIAGPAAGPSPSSSQRGQRPPSSGAPGQGPGSLRQRGQPGGSGLLSGAVEQPFVPKARGLVRGSTDALQFSARPASRGM